MSNEFWLVVRQALLLIVDAIEREAGISPTTADIRKQSRLLRRVGADLDE